MGGGAYEQASERPPQRTDSQSSAVARAAQESARTRVKAVVNIGRVELEMLRNKPEIRTIEPLARFQVHKEQHCLTNVSLHIMSSTLNSYSSVKFV